MNHNYMLLASELLLDLAARANDGPRSTARLCMVWPGGYDACRLGRVREFKAGIRSFGKCGISVTVVGIVALVRSGRETGLCSILFLRTYVIDMLLKFKSQRESTG